MFIIYSPLFVPDEMGVYSEGAESDSTIHSQDRTFTHETCLNKSFEKHAIIKANRGEKNNGTGNNSAESI